MYYCNKGRTIQPLCFTAPPSGRKPARSCVTCFHVISRLNPIPLPHSTCGSQRQRTARGFAPLGVWKLIKKGLIGKRERHKSRRNPSSVHLLSAHVCPPLRLSGLLISTPHYNLNLCLSFSFNFASAELSDFSWGTCPPWSTRPCGNIVTSFVVNGVECRQSF